MLHAAQKFKCFLLIQLLLFKTCLTATTPFSTVMSTGICYFICPRDLFWMCVLFALHLIFSTGLCWCHREYWVWFLIRVVVWHASAKPLLRECDGRKRKWLMWCLHRNKSKRVVTGSRRTHGLNQCVSLCLLFHHIFHDTANTSRLALPQLV